MNDPRQEERGRLEVRSSMFPTQLNERIKRGFSPTDDDLPFAQAERHQAELDQIAAARAKEREKR